MKEINLKGASPDIAEENIEKLKTIFPEVFTEDKVDFEKLQQVLGNYVEDSNERYNFTWNGKGRALRLSQTPSLGTLRPCKEESKDWDTTQNLYIEGDNLEVLKLLQKSYHSKVKMIYLDPPYNTGNDFVYPDDYHDSLENYKKITGQVDSEGNRLSTNTEASGRYHTDWLNMMYPRLRLARNVLTDDGVIFISIDDNEVHNLRKICDEVFGEENFINIITVKTKIAGVSGSSEGKSLKDATEFILVYAKNKSELLLNPVYIRTPLFDRITSYVNEGKSWKYTSVMTKLDEKVLIKEDVNRGMKFWGYKVLETKSVAAYAKELGISEEDVYNQYADRIFRTTNAQSSVRQTVIKETRGHDYPMYGCEYVPIKGKNEGQTIEILYKEGTTNDQRNMMMFLSDVVEKVDGIYYYMDRISSLWDDIEYNNLTKEGDMEFPNGKKPIKMMQRMINLVTDNDSIVLDFFSGSASTAHAVMQSNVEDNGNRRFILVQIPEKTDNDEFPTICEIGKERIRRAGEKIKDEKGLEAQNLDIGFKVLKLDTSNIRKWQPDYDNLEQSILDYVDNYVEGRTELDVVYEIILKYGLDLTYPVDEFTIVQKKVYSIGSGMLMICLDNEITTEVARGILAKVKELAPESSRVVFKDNGFKTDSNKTNIKEILKSGGIEEFITL